MWCREGTTTRHTTVFWGGKFIEVGRKEVGVVRNYKRVSYRDRSGSTGREGLSVTPVTNTKSEISES